MKNGDFLLIEYVGRVSETGEIFDLTDKNIAKKEGIFDKKRKYKPALVILGADMIICGVEEQLRKMKLGESKEFEIPPEMAFGERNPKLIKIIPLTKFIRQNINPVPGMFVEVDNKTGKIQSVTGGRVRVDFNNPLAGKRLRYWVKVIKVIKEPLEKITAILEHYGYKAEISLSKDKKVIIKSKGIDKSKQNRLRTIILKWVKDVKGVEFEKMESSRRSASK